MDEREAEYEALPTHPFDEQWVPVDATGDRFKEALGEGDTEWAVALLTSLLLDGAKPSALGEHFAMGVRGLKQRQWQGDSADLLDVAARTGAGVLHALPEVLAISFGEQVVCPQSIAPHRQDWADAILKDAKQTVHGCGRRSGGRPVREVVAFVEVLP